MRNTLILRASAIALLVSLGGCQFLGKLNLARSGSQDEQQAKAQRAMPSSLAEGREHLRANRNGLAIDAFNLALVRGEDPAAAFNGLGVAYARVGRNDLAYRFFKKANASAPDNPVYAGNLIRLVDSPAFALNQIDRAPAAPPARVEERPVAASAAAAAPRVPGKLYREGRGQISLTTRSDPMTTAPDKRDAAMTQVAVRPAVLRGPAVPTAAPDEPATAKAAEPAAAPASGKRKVIEFAPSAPADAKSSKAQPAPRNAAS
jgi:tetratricopeptide (TPR) repeat protein